MNKVMLANRDYETHMTDEGHQLQLGLQQAGWHLSGKGFDGLTDCREIIDKLKPEVVIVHDKRDWEPNKWAFRNDIGFENISALVDSVPVRLGVVKDAGSMVEYHRYFIHEIKATAILTYYHKDAVEAQAPWMASYPHVRTYHSVDADYIRARCLDPDKERKRGLVSGALSNIYPLRMMATKMCRNLGIDSIWHPGYNNDGTRTNDYLVKLSKYKVHIATSSRFHFSLRKIIESVAVGCIPITNLPAYDRLPAIDGALVRVPDDIHWHDLREVIDRAEASWDWNERMMWAEKCLGYYDYLQMGCRLDIGIEAHEFELESPSRHVHTINTGEGNYIP